MEQIKNYLKTLIVLFVILLFFLSCSDPLSEEDKETLVRTLIEGSIEAGQYVIFWNGKDEKKNLLSGGQYLCKFYTRDYGDELEMTALPVDSTRKVAYNDSTIIAAPPTPLHFELAKVSPNPFYINEGVNIAFDVPYRASILLTIHKIN